MSANLTKGSRVWWEQTLAIDYHSPIEKDPTNQYTWSASHQYLDAAEPLEHHSSLLPQRPSATPVFCPAKVKR
jgi:hypothetical protein